MSFNKLGLDEGLVSIVKEKGYITPTPIQEKSIPIILSGRDVLGGAQTGTGKTAAFALPLLQLLEKSEAGKSSPRALVLTPTRELANQVEKSIVEYGANRGLVSTTIYGGVSYAPQVKILESGVDIIVACPGRLLDLAKQEKAVLDNIQILILDEADRMLDMGFSFEIKRIMAMLPQKRQTLLFSATYSNEIKELADKILDNPEMIEVSPQKKTADNIIQVVHPVRKEQKRALIAKLIKREKWTRTLVFTKTKFGAENLKDYLLKEDIKAKAIHGNKSQAARNYALEDFKSGEIHILVATDVAARGLDIDDLPHVVNFDMPLVAEDYIHRIGRTGRAGKRGIAISFVSGEEQPLLWKIERLLKTKIDVEELDGFRQETKAELDSAKILKGLKDKKKSEKWPKKQRSPRKDNYGQNSDETVKKNKKKKSDADKKRKTASEVKSEEKKKNEDGHYRRLRAIAKKKGSGKEGNSGKKFVKSNSKQNNRNKPASKNKQGNRGRSR